MERKDPSGDSHKVNCKLALQKWTRTVLYRCRAARAAGEGPMTSPLNSAAPKLEKKTSPGRPDSKAILYRYARDTIRASAPRRGPHHQHRSMCTARYVRTPPSCPQTAQHTNTTIQDPEPGRDNKKALTPPSFQAQPFHEKKRQKKTPEKARSSYKSILLCELGDPYTYATANSSMLPPCNRMLLCCV